MPRRKKNEEAVSAVPISIEELISYPKSASVNEMAECIVKNPSLIKQLEGLGFQTKNPSGMTFKEAIIASQIESAMKGDLQAYRAVMDYAGKDEESCPLLDFVKENFGEDESRECNTSPVQERTEVTRGVSEDGKTGRNKVRRKAP